MRVAYMSWHETGWSPSEGYWDQAIIKDVLTRVPEWVDVNLLVTPGHWRTGQPVNEWLAEHGPAVVWITSDEEGDCPFWEVDTQVWKQMPNPNRAHWPDRVLPLGYTPHTRPNLQTLGLPLAKSGWVLSGQNTNVRRKAAFTALEKIDPTRIHPTVTFAAGVDPAEYIKQLWEAEWAPSPAGNVRADAFRTWEALEAGAVPILDATSPAGDRNVWPEMLGTHPLPVLLDWGEVGDIVSTPAPMAEVAAWYTRYKRHLVRQLVDDWHDLLKVEPWPEPVDRITTIITASPLPSHPDFTILAETVESVRARLPGNEICIAFDGPRDTDDRQTYEEHVRRVAWWANQYWPEVWCHYTGKWKHQAGTIRDVLGEIRSGIVLMCEADTPLTGDIPWQRLVEIIYEGAFNQIRFHYDKTIHPEHQYLMKGSEHYKTFEIIRTRQWSQRPHLALTQYYRDILTNLPLDARTYIEDWFYGSVANSPWDHNRLGIYAPRGDIQRSYHLDGRAGQPKGDFWW